MNIYYLVIFFIVYAVVNDLNNSENREKLRKHFKSYHKGIERTHTFIEYGENVVSVAASLYASTFFCKLPLTIAFKELKTYLVDLFSHFVEGFSSTSQIRRSNLFQRIFTLLN